MNTQATPTSDVKAASRTSIKSLRRERSDLSREIRDLYKAAIEAETTQEQKALYLSIENLTFRVGHLTYQINARMGRVPAQR